MPERHTSRPPAIRLLPRAGLLFALLTAAAGSVQALPISNVPLFTATGAPSNVMLLVDNSGSMRNLITDDAYDPTVSYPDWSVFCGQNGNQQCWDPDDGNIGFNELPHCATNSIPFDNDVVGGIRNGVVRCVRLPDSYGNNLTRVSGNYFNYLLENYGQNGSIVDIRNQIPDDHRLEVAKQVAISLVNANTNLRIGLSSFYSPDGQNGGPGGKIDAACGATTNTLVNAINNLDADSNTPLAETYYEITRYFQGLDGHFTDTDYTSPIIYRCQKSFVIAITDGFPTWDNSIPNDTGPNGTLPNYDGLDPATNQSDYPAFPQYSDGFQNHDGGSQADEGYTLFLDDLAKYAHETDMRDSGNDNEGVSFNDAEFPLQNLITHTVGFTLSNQMLQDAAEYGDGTFYSADNESELTDALQAAFSDIHARSSSAASVATNTAQLSSDTYLYQARFSGSDWSGQLLAFEINSDGTVGTEDWDAADELPAHSSRNIRTFNPTSSSGAEFIWAELTNAQRTALNTNASGTPDGQGQSRLTYIRGDQSNETPGGSFRNRGSLLGDIVNSDPVFVSAQNFGFSALSGTEGSTYSAFVQTKHNRPDMIYVGANDGMLHGFDAETGVERLAYVPNKVIPQLSRLTATNYNSNHRFFVDGSPRVVDAYLNSNWETVLVSTLGAGGKGVFALNVSDPANFNSSDVLWEFTDSQDSDMGVAIPQPTIARLNNGAWAAVVANGYNSGNQNAVLFLINLTDGSVIKEINTGVGNDNGLSTPIPIDVDNDRITDFIYAGDLKGNMWKFDVTGNNPNTWDVAFKNGNTPLPLFTACTVTDNNGNCTAASRQPITAKPEVGLNPTGGFVVYFGTGRYFATGDNNLTSPINSYYAIFDPNDKGANNPQPAGSGRSQLQQQSVLATATVGSEQVRVTSDNQPGASDKGWYIDLPVTGERQVSSPILRGGRIIFTTLIPDSDVCGFGGTSWLMEMDALSGGRLEHTPFDLNGDRQFDSDDFVTYNNTDVPVSGRLSSEGIIKTPGIITDYGAGIEFKYASGSTTGIDITVENAANATGRQSWRQLQ